MQLQSPKKPGEPARKKLTMDDFDKLSRLGQGAYGEVFLVLRKDLEKKFALKMIEKKFLSQEKKQYQAMVEKQVLCRLNHPGIVKLNASFTDPKRLYFVMEYCEGGQFKDFLKMNYGVLTNPMAAFYVGQIVNVLEYLHSNGIVHRDLKPENLMLSKTGHIKLIDFGTAEISQCKLLTQEFKDLIEEQKKVKQTHENQELDKVQPGLQKQVSRRSSFVGTCYYISPELLESNICEPPSDLWALGCIIYQLYYGRTPFWDKQ